MQQKILKYNISLPLTFLKEGKVFIAYSPVLDLSTSGATFKEAKERFSEVVQIFFEEITQKGTLDKVLTDLGWQKVQKEWTPPYIVSQESNTFRVPLIN